MHAAGKQVPAIERRPTLTGWGWLWEAFWTLNTCRPIGMTVGPIPWTAVQRYAEVEGLGLEETDMLHQTIRHMDEALLAHHREKGNRESKTINRGAVVRGATRR